MRFIFTCMVIVGLCLLALPLIPAFNGIQEERAQILASAATGVNLDVPPKIDEENPFPASVIASDTDAAALAGIEPAAGDDAFTGGFTNEAPAALADPATDPLTAPQQPSAE